ncbi:glutamate 5-kinase [Dehalogenimonas formicexedens]|uniref:Glutamate 5-kinase n=1 Tax=Dehalogenimonas formicexedens TaxID=1839801 RepID=A0A1P8F8A7_9CHLR|nr:glutamate 5-kinase [Dehalogenimonas formicexedens]APV44670.1 glutamate 5-kinase [Dehalogenimonas formicexedens]
MNSEFCYKRIVIKLGTNLLTGGAGKLDREVMSGLVAQMAALVKRGVEITVVTSGAIAAGKEKLGLFKKNKDMPFKQVLASVGQNRLMNVYDSLFAEHGLTVAQALLTKSDLHDRSGYLNARNTLLALIELGVVTIVNENDVVAVDEIQEAKFGDNDNLSAMVANLVDADLLLILSDIDGLYTANPRTEPSATLIPVVEKVTQEIEALAGGVGSNVGTGGMITKIEAARLATSSGVRVIIASGHAPGVVERVITGESIGTHFLPHASPDARHRWLVSGLSSRGRIIIDGGAARAVARCSSLLPAGVKSVEGAFKRGDIVRLTDEAGTQVGYGITNYDAIDVDRIKGLHSEAIGVVLGHDFGDEIIHRNNLAVC